MDADTAPSATAAEHPLTFTGRADEYFRIWIVNICLSVLTLGIYSAWAKVRRKRYFYGSTRLDGSAFDYLGDPKAILKGRVIVVAGFLAYSLLTELDSTIAALLTLALALSLPWIVIRALQFNARVSTYRGVRFGFKSTYGQFCGALLVPLLLTPVTLGLAYPFYLHRKRRYFLERSSYGQQAFGFRASLGAYYGAALKLLLAFGAFVVGSVVTFGIGALPLYILLRAYAEAAFARLAWGNTQLADIGFDCSWTAFGLFKLYAVNAVAIVVSLGLLIPWAAIRTARYKLSGIRLRTERGLGDVLASVQDQVGAVGDEAGELLGFDFGL